MKEKVLLSAAIAASLVGILITGGSSAGGASSLATADVAVALPISASTSTEAESSMLIAMGHLHDPSNTFWELFLRTSGSASWVLHTPAGVASNGGLTLAAPPSGPLLAGFLTSAYLRFSPVAQSTDGGATWSPGELPSPLTPVPNALAVDGSGRALALVSQSRDGQRVMTSSDSLATWRTLSSDRALEQSVPTCHLQEVTAVAYTVTSQPLLGLACDQGDVVGLLVPAISSGAPRSGWRNVGPSLPAGLRAPSVIRLQDTVNGLTGLAQARSGTGSSLVAFWGMGSSEQWLQTTPLPVPKGWTVKATAIGGGTGQGVTVLLGSGARRRIVDVVTPGAPWVTFPASPREASGVAAVGNEIDAFVVDGSHLTVWTSTSARSPWHRAASISVPVPYGSSS